MCRERETEGMFPGVNECGWLCGMSINVYMIWASENVDSSVCVRGTFTSIGGLTAAFNYFRSPYSY